MYIDLRTKRRYYKYSIRLFIYHWRIDPFHVEAAKTVRFVLSNFSSPIQNIHCQTVLQLILRSISKLGVHFSDSRIRKITLTLLRIIAVANWVNVCTVFKRRLSRTLYRQLKIVIFGLTIRPSLVTESN